MPPPLRPGDVIHVVAPSGPFDPTLAWLGIGWLARRFQVRFDRSAFHVTGYLAGHDQRRHRELQAALDDAACRAVVAIRGGYGLNRIAHDLDWRRFEQAPKWIVGFSDVTALHVECTSLGIMSMHASMAAHLGRGDERTRSSWLSALETPTEPRVFEGLASWIEGEAEGTIAGGNLTLLHACAVAGRLCIPNDALLFIEDIGERPYRIDRMLTTLRVGGHLRGVRGVVVGQFTDSPPGPDRVTVEDALRASLAPLGVPVVAGLRAGHGEPNEPVMLGARARIEARGDGSVVRVG